MDKGSFTAFLAGVGVGIGIGMLFAPRAGGETRQILKEKAGEGKEYVKHRATEFREQAGEYIEKGRETLGRQKDNLSQAMEAGKQAYRETVQPPAPPAPEGGTL
jgi:gas vesicle protein